MFALSAIPTLLPEGEHKGHLEYVTFIGTDGFNRYRWSSTNTGTFVEDFPSIVPRANAEDILTRLRRGEPVLFPGLFEIEQIRHIFGGAGND